MARLIVHTSNRSSRVSGSNSTRLGETGLGETRCGETRWRRSLPQVWPKSSG